MYNGVFIEKFWKKKPENGCPVNLAILKPDWLILRADPVWLVSEFMLTRLFIVGFRIPMPIVQKNIAIESIK